MIALGLDTSGDAGSVALAGTAPDGRALAEERVFTEGLIHGVALAPAVAEMLASAGLQPGDLGVIAAGLGPGSYTGVRVGVAFAKTLAFAAGVPLLGVPSLDAMAAAAPADRDVAAVRDARRGSLYFALYAAGRTEPRPSAALRLLPLAGADREIPAGALLIGDAAEKFPDLLSGRGREIGDPALGRAPALEVARLALSRLAAEGPVPPHDLAPIYLRPSEAEERWSAKE